MIRKVVTTSSMEKLIWYRKEQRRTNDEFNALKDSGQLSRTPINRFLLMCVSQAGNRYGSIVQARLIISEGLEREKKKVKKGDCFNPRTKRVVEIKTNFNGGGGYNKTKFKLQQVRIGRDVDYIVVAADVSRLALLTYNDPEKNIVPVYVMRLSHDQMVYEALRNSRNSHLNSREARDNETRELSVAGCPWYSKEFMRWVSLYNDQEASVRFTRLDDKTKS